MSEDITFLVTILIEEWKSGGQTFGPSLMKWLLEVKINDVWEEDFGVNNLKVMEELVKKQPQLEGKIVLDVEQVNIKIA